MTAVVVDIGNNSGGDDSGDIAARLFTAGPLQSSSLWMTQDGPTSSPHLLDEQLKALANAQSVDPTSAPLVTPSISTFTTQKAKLGGATCPMDWVWHERRPWNDQSCRCA